MIRMNPQAFSCLYGKDVIAFGTGAIGKRMIPFLVQDPTIRLHGVTNSRITVEDEGTFLDTGLPLRSVRAWAKLLPNATIFLTTFEAIDEITAICKGTGFQKFQLITGEMVNALIQTEDQLAESQISKMLSQLCLANELRDAHKAAFSEFKGCNKGKTVAVVGTGPTLRHYAQIPGIPHIGVNASFLKEDLTLDYYFITHYRSDWCEELKNYDFIKFFGMNTKNDARDQFPEYIVEENGGRKFFSTLVVPGTGIHADIAYYPLMDFYSIIFRAIHFALYTHPKRLLLVGCDCAPTGYYNEQSGESFDDMVRIPQWIDGYRAVKRFVAIHYPEVEIISVNPVGLKGMFSDIYTESYLKGQPELMASEYKILDSKDYMGG